MTVQCPRCSTRWRVANPPEGDNPVFKCGRCHNTFRRFPGAPQPQERPATSERHRAAPKVDNLEFIFPRRRDAEPADERDDTTTTPAAELDQLGDASSETDDDISRDHPIPQLDPTRVLHVEDTMRGSTPTPAFGPIRRALLLFVAAHALLAVLIRANPELGGQWLGRIPLFGAALAARPAPLRDVQLRNVEGRFARIRSARRVFVISGEAVNNSRAALERIEIEGTLYGPGGELASMTVSTGNRTTLRLAELSESEIGLLQRFDPRITVAPGESAPFSLVFLGPPANLREFSSRVSSVRPSGPLSAPPPSDRVRPPSLG